MDPAGASAEPPASVTDEALAARLIAGDQRAFDALVLRWRDRIVDLALLLTGDREAAEDVGQEAFLRLLRRPSAYDPRRPFGAWICTVARNLCRDRHRRNSARSRHEGRTAAGPRPAPDPCEAAAAAEAGKKLKEAIAALPRRFREAYVCCAVRGMSYEEAAGICGCPAKTVSTRLARARRRLLERMRGWL